MNATLSDALVRSADNELECAGDLGTLLAQFGSEAVKTWQETDMSAHSSQVCVFESGLVRTCVSQTGIRQA